jgi:nitrite reductase (NADH) small subunit
LATVKVARVDELPAGTGKVVQAGTTELALFNVGGTFYALDNRCTHMGGPLGEGELEGTQVTCPWHGSIFDITSGAVVRGPARRPVAIFKVRVEGNDVSVELP